MAKKISNEDYNGLMALNMRTHSGTAWPGSPVEGIAFYRTDLHYAAYWNGTVWQPVDASYLTASIPNTALVTNPLARANHTGTQLASTISNFASTVLAYTLDQFGTPTTNLNFGGFRITNVGAGVSGTDVPNLAQLQAALNSAVAGIVAKQAVRLVSSTNLTLSGLSAIDGVTPVAGDRILAAGQSTASANGVYIAAAGAWTRSTNDTNGELDLGATWFVEQGTTYAGSNWRLNAPTNGAITTGTTSVTIGQQTASQNYTASLGVQLVGSNFQANYGAGLTLSGNALVPDFTVVGKAPYKSTIGDGTTAYPSITHTFGTQRVLVSVQDATTHAKVDCDWTAIDTTHVQFFPANVLTSAQLEVSVLG